jgi:hypothetical protein
MAAHRRDASGCLSTFTQRIRRYEAVLAPLGLWELFAAMPRRAQELFVQHKFPDPVLEFDASFPTDHEHRALRKTLERGFAEASIDAGVADITVRDFFSVIAGLKHTVQGTRNQPNFPEPCYRFMELAAPLLEVLYEPFIPHAWPPLHTAVISLLVAHSRVESQLLTATLRQDMTSNGKYVIRMIVSRAEPQRRHVALDGAARPMVRIGTANEWDGVRWTSWEGKPVYAQSHALRQLRDRVNLSKTTPYLESWLHESLNAPVVVDRQGADLLVEYRISGYRLGYLVITPLHDVVAVRTFKFLTMESTPEARMLEKRLRLTRRDVDWLGLHELAAFTQTDLRTDPVLRALLTDCGCAHLFELAENRNFDFAPTPKPFAAEMKRYLRLAA